jgi:mannose-1-phosphate guanylyltransferase
VIGENIHYFNSKGNIVKSNKKTVLIDVEDLVVVETDEYLIVSKKDSIQKIKEIKNKIQ